MTEITTVFDADNHYYEALDAFTRYIEPEFKRRCMMWAEVNGRQMLLVGGKINRFIPNPTFDMLSAPGSLEQYFRGRNPKGDSVKEDLKVWCPRSSIGPFMRVAELDRDTANTAAGQHEPVNKLHAVAL